MRPLKWRIPRVNAWYLRSPFLISTREKTSNILSVSDITMKELSSRHWLRFFDVQRGMQWLRDAISYLPFQLGD